MRPRLRLMMAAGLVVAAATLDATTVVPLTFSDLVSRAETIFRGRVVDVSSAWDSSPRRGQVITTRVIVDVDRVLKGSAGLRTVLDFLGGRVGDVELRVAAMPQFAVGEEVILFVQRSQAGSMVVGFMQGRFRVTRAAGRSAFVLTHDSRPFATPAMIGAPFPLASAEPIRPMSLDAFESAIVRQVTRQ